MTVNNPDEPENEYPLVAEIHYDPSDGDAWMTFKEYFLTLTRRQQAHVIGQVEQGLAGMRENMLYLASREEPKH